MGEFDAIRKPSSPTPWFVGGGVLLLAGAVVLVLWVIQLMDGTTDAQVGGAQQGLSIVAAAFLIASGLFVVVMGRLKKRRQDDRQ